VRGSGIEPPTPLLAAGSLLTVLPNRVGIQKQIYPQYFIGQMLPLPFEPGAEV
jgi:hypothetical protein